jgi:quinol monooxygenase YgiN
MKSSLSRILPLALLLLFAGSARAQNEVYVVMHIDTIPSSTNGPTAVELLRQWESATRKEPGCARFEVLQQSDRANHFAVVGVWKDQKAFDDHEAAEHTRKFRERIQPILGSPFDERLHRLLP